MEKLLELLRKCYYFAVEHKRKSYLNYLQKQGLRLGKNVVIHSGFFFDPSHCFLISVGDNCVLAPGVKLIAHDASSKRLIGYTKIGRIDIGDDCFLGNSVIVLTGVSIGRNSIIGAGSVVTKDIPADSVAAGNPARVLCSTKSYTDKLLRQSKGKKIFDDEYGIERLSDAQRHEVLAAVTDDIGYMI